MTTRSACGYAAPAGKEPDAGFTILELATTLFLAGVILVGIIGMYDIYKRADYLNASKTRQEEIAKALEAFRVQNGYFPCAAGPTLNRSSNLYGRGDRDTPLGYADGVPAGGDGRLAAGVNADCAQAATGGAISVGGVRIGALPVRSLDLPDDYIANIAGYQYIYAVTESVSQYDLVHPPTPTSPVIDMTSGKISLLWPGTTASVVTPAGSGLYVLVDPSRTGFGAYTRDGVAPPASKACGAAPVKEQENCDNDATFNYGNATSYSSN